MSETPPPPRPGGHVPVLLREVLEILDPRPGDVVVDCTAGLGGHAAALGEKVGAGGRVVLFDLDAGNLAAATARVRALGGGPSVVGVHASFGEMGMRLKGLGVGGAAEGAEFLGGAELGVPGLAPGPLIAGVILADLGFSSTQVDDAGRGFSFMRDGPLDMRLNPGAAITAAELVQTMPERELMELIRDLGEEPPEVARRIASKVVQERQSVPISRTVQLAEIVRAAVPAARAHQSALHPATKTFQALRICVNDELGSLQRLLETIARAASHARDGRASVIAPGARIGIISFHSLEDRPVKQAFSAMVESGTAEHVTRKPVTASEEEIARNPRSRSAKLRVIRVVGGR
ncbi:MAG: 16S rRNA (cytosine(1402)-N(4))-methyltransferase RsmH [Phycisphaerales bacterium]|nr:16S rRNA (cytosine(1402)-N(4))-methyltransferase RsmH [Phycisphaerales bacterium]